MFLVSLFVVALAIRPTLAEKWVMLSDYIPVDEPLHVVTSSFPRTWLEMSSQCNTEHPGYNLLTTIPEHVTPEVMAGCPNGTLVPSGLVRGDGNYAWDNVDNVRNANLPPSEESQPDPVNSPYSAFLWPTTTLRKIGDETKFTCAVCEMARRSDVVINGVYPQHNNSIFKYDLELVSHDHFDDVDLVANGTDLANKLIGDLAHVFNISMEALSWHGARLNEDKKAVVHVYYDRGDVKAVWEDYVLWNDQYFVRKMVENFQVVGINLNTECVITKRFLSNVKKETYLTGTVDVEISNRHVITRECYWHALTESSLWSNRVTWEPQWKVMEADEKAGLFVTDILKPDRAGPEYKKALRNFDVTIAFELQNQLLGWHKFFSLHELTSLANGLIHLHTRERPHASALSLLSYSMPLNLARIYMLMPLSPNAKAELCRASFINILLAELDASDPVVGLALTLPDESQGKTQLEVSQLNFDNVSLAPNTSHIVVTVSDSIAFTAERLAIAAYFAHLDSPDATTQYDDSIDGWMAGIHVTFRRAEDYSGDLGKDFVDIAFKPVFHSPTLRGKCAERNVTTEEWLADTCRILKSMRDGMLVCRCKNLNRVENFTTVGYIIYGFDASLSTYLANNLTLIIVIVIACFLSVLGLLSVILTAVLFQKWRADQGHKIFLQMVLALTVNLVLGFLNNFYAVDTKSMACVAIGAVRHYSFLAMFFWLMVLSGLQVKRLTTISGTKSTAHLTLKVSLIAWGVPLLPIVILLAWDTGFYKSEVSNRGYCYPEDVAFQATVQGPAGVILIANLGIFVVILNHIYGWVKCSKDVVVRKHTGDDRAAQLRNLGNSIFVFFLFGFTWTFHFLSEEGIINSEFLYEFLFLITASFHLFMLSLFCIVLDKKTRALWKRAFRGKRGLRRS